MLGQVSLDRLRRELAASVLVAAVGTSTPIARPHRGVALEHVVCDFAEMGSPARITDG
jgi:hypothetical protein